MQECLIISEMCVRDKLCISHVWHVNLVSGFSVSNLPPYNSIIFFQEILVLVSMGPCYTVCLRTPFKKIMELLHLKKDKKRIELKECLTIFCNVCEREIVCQSCVACKSGFWFFVSKLPPYNSIIFLKEILVLVSMGTWYTVCMRTPFKNIMELLHLKK